MANLIQKKQEEMATAKTPQKQLKNYIKQMEGEIARALPSVMTPERFTRITLSALSATPKLYQCSPESFLGAMMTAAQLGVEPNTPLGQAYLVPYYNGKKQCTECQFQLGFKGMIDLAYRSGKVSTIQAHVVYANDTFNYSFGLEPKMEHIPATGERGEPTHVYAMFRTKDGGYGYEVMSMEEVRQHAQKYSKTFGFGGPWQTNFEDMAKKTVLKKALKYAPLASDFVHGIVQDETTKTEISSDMYEVEDTTIYAEAEEIKVDTETGEIIEDQSNE